MMDKRKHNYFFGVYQVDYNTQDEICLGMINVLLDSDFYFDLCSYAPIYISNFIDEYFENPTNKEILNNKIGYLYGKDLKLLLSKNFPDICIKLASITSPEILSRDDVQFRLVSSYEYRQYNPEYDRQLKFIEYINSEKSFIDKETNITKDMLYEAGFELQELETNLYIQFLKDNPEYGEVDPEDYVCLRKWTNDDRPLKLDIENRTTNRGTQWYLHIDNSDCNTIGSADIDTVWEFNTLMQVFGSKFRL